MSQRLSRLSCVNIVCVTPAKFRLVLVAAARIALVLGSCAATEGTVNNAFALVERASAVKQSPVRALTQMSEQIDCTIAQADKPPESADTSWPLSPEARTPTKSRVARRNTGKKTNANSFSFQYSLLG